MHIPWTWKNYISTTFSSIDIYSPFFEYQRIDIEQIDFSFVPVEPKRDSISSLFPHDVDIQYLLLIQVAYNIPVDNSTPESSTGAAVAASELSLEELMAQMKSM